MRRPGGFELLTRMGFVARGSIYILIGYLALRYDRSEDGAGALDYLAHGSGRLAVAAIAIGLLGYGLWRIVDALADTDGHGSAPKGVATRLGGAGSGLAHLGLAFLAATQALGQNGAGGDNARQSAATALTLPGGTLLLAAAAAALAGMGGWQLMKAWLGRFLRHLDPGAAGRAWVIWLGRLGYAARGLVFLAMAWFLAQAAITSNAREAGGVAQVLSSAPDAVRPLLAAGLLLFGLFSLVEARYRRIDGASARGAVKRLGEAVGG